MQRCDAQIWFMFPVNLVPILQCMISYPDPVSYAIGYVQRRLGSSICYWIPFLSVWYVVFLSCIPPYVDALKIWLVVLFNFMTFNDRGGWVGKNLHIF